MFCVAEFLISFALMLSELLIIRQWKIAFSYNVVFFVIPIVMFGMSIGAIAAFYLEQLKTNLKKSFLFFYSLFFTFIIPSTFLFLVFIKAGQLNKNASSIYLASFVGSLIFFFWGLINASIFYRRHQQILSLYISNLLGSILGTILAIILMNKLGTSKSIELTSIFALFSTIPFFFLWKASKKKNFIYALLVLLISVITYYIIPSNFFLFHTRKMQPTWIGNNAVSQIELYPVSPIHLFQDINIQDNEEIFPNTVKVWFGTTDERFSPLRFIKFDKISDLYNMKKSISYAPFLFAPKEEKNDVFIFGTGGGFDILQALIAGSKEITTVELNPLVLKAAKAIHADQWLNFPEVKFKLNEGRRFLKNTTKKFDLIVLPHIKGYGAIGGQNLDILTSYSLTKEALKLYISKLNKHGALAIRDNIRWQDWQLKTLIEATKEKKLEGNISFYLVSGKKDYVLVLKKGKYTHPYLNTIKEEIINNGFSFKAMQYHDIKSTIISTYAITDDHPYPLRILYHLKTKPKNNKKAPTTNGYFTKNQFKTLWLTFNTQIVIALILLLTPLIFKFLPNDNYKNTTLLLHILYFAGIGFGFLNAELIVIEKLTLLLGYPMLAFGLGITIFLFSGTLSTLIIKKFIEQNKIFKFASIISLCTFFFGIVTITLLEKLTFYNFTSDKLFLLLTIIIPFPFACLIGCLFPMGFKILSSNMKPWLPIFLAVNGFAAIVAGVMIRLVSFSLGFRMSFYLGQIGYIISAIAAYFLMHQYKKQNIKNL